MKKIIWLLSLFGLIVLTNGVPALAQTSATSTNTQIDSFLDQARQNGSTVIVISPPPQEPKTETSEV